MLGNLTRCVGRRVAEKVTGDELLERGASPQKAGTVAHSRDTHSSLETKARGMGHPHLFLRCKAAVLSCFGRQLRVTWGDFQICVRGDPCDGFLRYLFC
jgi:hypothetical protein